MVKNIIMVYMLISLLGIAVSTRYEGEGGFRATGNTPGYGSEVNKQIQANKQNIKKLYENVVD